MLVKLHAYGFSSNALILKCSYLKIRKQRVKINNNFNDTKTVIAEVPQGSLDGPLLFNLFINDLVLFLTEILSNYAEKLKIHLVTNWFYKNFMVLNCKKCHFMCNARGWKNETFTFKDVCYKNSKECYVGDNY